ncbi:MAG: NADH-quinone oxidoreductase subunit H [Vicinamibacteria bacterium]|nr:NADH-quinone oxidoreductase subunit H [Vicinamibacteria bacterium]
MSLLAAVGYGLVNVLLALAVAPLCEGIIRKVTARFIQSRQGPPILQPYYDLLKLLGKEDIESGEVPVMQRLSAYLALGASLSLATLVPMGARAPMGEGADAILLVYVLTLCGVSTLLAGLAAGSPYSMMGVSRGMMTMLALEPILAVAVIVGALRAGSLRLDDVLYGSLFAPGGAYWSSAIVLLILILSLQAFVERMPFDIAEAETEIMEGAFVEYSGPKLALFKYSQSVRMFVYIALFFSLIWPLGRHWIFPLGLAALIGQVLLAVLLVTLISATHARYRIDQALRYYALLLLIAVGALGLKVMGW